MQMLSRKIDIDKPAVDSFIYSAEDLNEDLKPLVFRTV
jgi:hypothetical protein